jgi:hypothetical protein
MDPITFARRAVTREAAYNHREALILRSGAAMSVGGRALYRDCHGSSIGGGDVPGEGGGCHGC